MQISTVRSWLLVFSSEDINFAGNPIIIIYVALLTIECCR